MLERAKFVMYAAAFEVAFRTDRWGAVAACFTEDGVYAVDGTRTRWDGESHGRGAIVAQFKRLLDLVDRRYDRRQVGLEGPMQVEGGVLTLRWKARYTIGAERFRLTGVSRCRWRGARIVELRDEMDPELTRAWAERVGAL